MEKVPKEQGSAKSNDAKDDGFDFWVHKQVRAEWYAEENHVGGRRPRPERSRPGSGTACFRGIPEA